MSLWIILSLIVASLSTCPNTYYNYDGSCNNVANPLFGAANHTYRQGPEGIQVGDVPQPAPPGQVFTLFSNRPNERVVSNAVIAEHTVNLDDRGLNLVAMQFGQLITHDLTKNLRPGDFRSNVLITEPTDSFLFLPNGAPKTSLGPTPSINVRRSGGETIDGKFYVHNEISGYLDAHFIYGSTPDENNAIRGPKVDGKVWLKPFTVDLSRVLGYPAGSQVQTYTEQNMLPLLTETGLPVDIANTGQNISLVFSAGDSRVSENMILLTLQTVWAREHNRQAGFVKAAHPTWNDERIFQKARVLTTALYQHITYNEYLPTVWGQRHFNTHVGRYRGYRSSVDGATGASFAGAGMRVGHSTVRMNIQMYTACGEPSNLAFNGTLIQAGQAGAGPFAAGAGEILGLTQGITNILQSAVFNKAESGDNQISDALRNINIPSPFATGVDVSVQNLRRGRINGVPNYHTLRQHYHPLAGRKIYETPGCNANENSPSPDPLACFTKFISSTSIATTVRNLYGKINNIDAYLGLLVEKKNSKDSLFGPTGTGIVLDQFRVSRDGDRFYYENLPASVLSPHERREIERTQFSEVLKRNTGLVTVDRNAFLAPRTPGRNCHDH